MGGTNKDALILDDAAFPQKPPFRKKRRVHEKYPAGRRCPPNPAWHLL